MNMHELDTIFGDYLDDPSAGTKPSSQSEMKYLLSDKKSVLHAVKDKLRQMIETATVRDKTINFDDFKVVMEQVNRGMVKLL